MLKNDLIHIISDGIMQHEGWSVTTGQAYPHLNPGDLHMDGQPGATGTIGSEATFPDFWTGKQALNNDINAKLIARYNTIRDLITEYAPPSQNNTEAYIASLTAFLLARNVVLNPDSPIDAFLSQCETPVVVIVANDIWEPGDWAIFQAAIAELATFMPLYAFSTRYSNIELSGDIVTVQAGMPTNQEVQMISAEVVRAAIALYNNGQTLNLFVYKDTIMDGQPNPVGGCEYENVSVSQTTPYTAIGSVAHRGASDILARDMFHELIHELFQLTKQPDVLHADLIADRPNGYELNLAVDLVACFTSNQLNTPSAVAQLAADERSLK